MTSETFKTKKKHEKSAAIWFQRAGGARFLEKGSNCCRVVVQLLQPRVARARVVPAVDDPGRLQDEVLLKVFEQRVAGHGAWMRSVSKSAAAAA
jgi:hypothetical protein